MTELFPYQQIGVEWLSKQERFALLADDMGLGKTIQAIYAADLIQAQTILVLCPAIARINWLREFTRFSKIKRETTLIFDSKTPPVGQGLIICSYDLAVKIRSEFKTAFDVLILDESHFLKSVDSQRSHVVYGRSGLVHQAKRIWCLSGTPAPNTPADLWTMFKTFGKTKYSYEEYVETYCHYYKAHNHYQVTGTKKHKIPELNQILRTFMLRRKKEEVMKELPPIKFDYHLVEKGPVDLEMNASFFPYLYPQDKTKELFEKLKREENLLKAVIETTGFKNSGLTTMQGLAPHIGTLRRYIGIQKVEGVAELVTKEMEAKAYSKIVIFGIHRDVIDSLRIKLEQFNPVTLYGGTDPKKRQRNVDRFQKTQKYQIFIANIQAAGTAITLTAAHHIIFIEQSWTPGDNLQGIYRCHRIGQEKPVFVRFIGVADSIDEQVMYFLKKKTKELNHIFDPDLPSNNPFDIEPKTDSYNQTHIDTDQNENDGGDIFS